MAHRRFLKVGLAEGTDGYIVKTATSRYNSFMNRSSPPACPAPAITFWGAARSVTGSMHLIEAEGRRILLDCGLTQGRREEARQRNRRFPFHPDRLDAVLLSHAHIDHCGNLPSLVRQGFSGAIYCTPATRDLIGVMLEDSARIQEEEAAHDNIRRNYREPWQQPLYTRSDAEQAVDMAVAFPCGKAREILPGVFLTLHEAGHILGSAISHLHFAAGGSLTFTGDLGRRGAPIIKPTSYIPPADVLVCESTYGGHVHEPIDTSATRLAEVVRHTVARGGKGLIPAFSLGRSQLVVHYLFRAIRRGESPPVPID